MEKILKSDQNELSRLRKMQSRGSGSKYFLILLVLIAVVNILDEVTSNLTVTVQSSFVTEFFVNNPFLGKFYKYEEGLALHSTIGIVTYVFGIITPFYKALADKWGRKPLFAISTLGMALGLLIIYLSSSYIMFLVGFAFISFFKSEIERYKKEALPYGVPLDSREKYTKSDWLIWVASLADNKDDFEFFSSLLWKAYDTMRTRVPMTDWYYTDTSEMVGFRHRNVQGGLFIRLMLD